MSPTIFYEWMTAGEAPSTSQINQLTYFRYFEAMLEVGVDVLYLSFTSGLNDTYQSSLIVAAELEEKYPGQRVACIDSLRASIGQGLFVLLAAQKKQEGLTIDEIVVWAQQSRLHAAQWFTADDLNHLRRGGRVSSVAVPAGLTLGIKPISHVDSKGKFVAAMKVRGRRKLVDALIGRIARTGTNPAEQITLVRYGSSEKDARQLKVETRERLRPKEVILCDIGPMIGAHVGPGILAVSF